MKSESFYLGLRGHVARFFRVSNGFEKIERKVSFFGLEKAKEDHEMRDFQDRRKEKVVGIYDTRFVSVQKVRI